MHTVLRKKIELKNAKVYLRLKKEICRKDIQEYLCEKTSANMMVDKRVKDYLKTIGIYDEQLHLTGYGKTVRETGMVTVYEEGKYQIWYTQNDLLFGNKIFYFRRESPRGEWKRDDTIKIKLDDNSEHYCLSTAQGEFFKFNLMNGNQNAYTGQILTDKTVCINFSWEWKNLESSKYIFSGSIETDRIENVIDSDKDISSIIKDILPDWDDGNKRYKINFSKIENDNDSLARFEYSYNGNWEGFHVRIDHLPIEPYTINDAVQWRNYLFNVKLIKEYVHPNEYDNYMHNINQEDGFKAYMDNLDIPDIKKYITTLDPAKKSDRGLAYWHLAAPLDLNVDIPQALKLSVISLSEGEKISFQEFVTKFSCGTNTEKLFYYDRYVITDYQQRSVAAFLKSFGISEMMVITDTSAPNFNGCLAKDNPQIAVKDITAVFQNKKDSQHDRFLIFKNGDSLTVWTSTNSIDFIRFKCKGAIKPEEEGDVQKSITYSRINPDILGIQLKNFILKRSE